MKCVSAMNTLGASNVLEQKEESVLTDVVNRCGGGPIFNDVTRPPRGIVKGTCILVDGDAHRRDCDSTDVFSFASLYSLRSTGLVLLCYSRPQISVSTRTKTALKHTAIDSWLTAFQVAAVRESAPAYPSTLPCIALGKEPFSQNLEDTISRSKNRVGVFTNQIVMAHRTKCGRRCIMDKKVAPAKVRC